MGVLFVLPATAPDRSERLVALPVPLAAQITTTAELEAALQNSGYDAVLVADDLDWAAPVGLIHALVARAPSLPLILVGYRGNPTTAAAAGRAGAYYLAATELSHLANLLAATRAEVRRPTPTVTHHTPGASLSALPSTYLLEVVVHADGQRQASWVTETFTAITGYTVAELGSEDGYRSIVHPDDLGQYDAFISQLMSGSSASAEYRIIRKDGVVRWMRASLHPNPDQHDEHSGRWLGVVEDITHQNAVEAELVRSMAAHTDAIRAATARLERELAERRQAEAELRRSEEMLRTILGSMPVLLDAMDNDDRIVVWNQECERVTGYTAAEMLGRNDYMELLYPDPVYRRQIIESWHERGQRCRSWELLLTAKDGTQKIVSWSNIATEYPIPGWRSWGIGVDITAQREAERERLLLERKLLETQKLESLGSLAGGIAHDFNNLLAVIIGNIELLQLDTPADSPSLPVLINVEQTARRATELLKQLLVYAGRSSASTAPLELNRLIEELAELLRTTVGDGVTLEFELAADLPEVEGDPTQLRQLLMNLVMNATEAINPDGTRHSHSSHAKPGRPAGSITITTSQHSMGRAQLDAALLGAELPAGLYLLLSVADSGVGMSETTQARIFDPFFSTKFTGRGLGLAAVLGIVRAHRGAVLVHSIPARGSRFTIALPASVAHNPPRALPGSDWRANGTLLVIDDEPGVAELAATIARRLGFQVLLAPGGEAGLALLEANTAEVVCVLLDLTMPRMSGMEVFAQIRRSWPDLPVILTSGYNTEEYGHAVAARNAIFLKKPFAVAELRAVLRQATGG
jgi:PAS domain S-box-containing protein